METFTFYSYKGGVGRSVAVNHIAERLAELQQVIFVIDFDLEAPGLHYKFKNEIAKAKELQGSKKGIVDYIYDFLIENKQSEIPLSLSDYYYTLDLGYGPKGGKIYLMPAGEFEKNEYWSKLSAIDWKNDFLNGEKIGLKLLLDLKARIKKDLMPEYLLIDSRTGISDISTITLKVLADKVIVLAVNNEENLDGSTSILNALNLADNQWNKKNKELFFALSRLPRPLNNIEEEKENIIVKGIKEKFTKGLIKKNNFITLHEDRELIWEEKKIVDLKGTPHLQIKEDYLSLLELLTRNSKHSELIVKIRDDEKAKSFFNDAVELIDGQKYEEALSVLRNATQLFPNNHNLYSLCAVVYLRLDKPSLSVKASSKQIKLNPRGFLGYENRGLAYTGLKKYKNAIEDFTKAIKLNSKEAGIFTNRALAYGDHGYYKHAISDLSKAIELNKNASFNYGLRGIFYTRINNYKIAIEDFGKCFELNPTNSPVLLLKINTYIQQRKYASAFKELAKAKNLFPDEGKFYSLTALTYSKLKKYKAAIIEFSRAIRLDKNNLELYWQRASAYFSVRKYNLAIADCSLVLRTEKNSKDALFIRGFSYYNSKRFSEAIKDFTKFLAITPNGDVYEYRAHAYKKNRDYKRAIMDFSRAIKIIKNSELYNERADCYLIIKDFKNAIKDAKRSINIDETFTLGYVTLAEAYGEMVDKINFYRYLNMAVNKGFKVSRYINRLPFSNYKNEKRFINILKREKPISNVGTLSRSIKLTKTKN